MPDKAITSGPAEKHGLFNFPPPYSFFVKPLIIFVSLLAVYALAGFYLVPAVLKTKIPEIILEETGRKAAIEKIEFNPFKFYAGIRGFKILEKNGKQFAGFDNLSVKLGFWQSITSLALVIEDISLKQPMVRLVKDKQGKFNFEDMIKPSKKPEEKKQEEGGFFPVRLAALSLDSGKVLWEDSHFSKPVNEEVNPINLKLTGFSTEAKSKAKLDFNFAVKSGGKLEWKANAGVNPLFSEGNIRLDALQLQTIIALAMADAPFAVQGQELFNLEYKFEQKNQEFNVSVSKTRLELKDIQFADNSPAKNLLKTPSIAFETDATVTAGKDKLDVVVKKASLNGKELKYSNQQDEPVFLELPEISFEADVKVNQGKDATLVTTEKARLGLKNLQFNGLKDQMVEAKIPGITLETAYRIGLKDKAAEITVSQGKFDLHDLQVSEQGEQKSLIKIPVFGLAGIGVDVSKKEVVIDSVMTKDAQFETWLTKEGIINYQALVQKTAADESGQSKAAEASPDSPAPPTVSAKPDDSSQNKPEPSGSNKSDIVKSPDTAATEAKKDWLIKVNNLEIQNYGLNFEDRTLKKPELMTVKPVNLKVSNISSKLDGKLPFQVDIGVNRTGSIKLKGDAVIVPLLANVDVDIKGIELDKFQPYVNKFAKVDIIDGNFNTKGRLSLKQAPDKPVDVKYRGQTNVADFVTRDQILNKDLVKWENLTFKDLDVDMLANKYSASALLIEKPYARVTVRKDKTVNFSDLVVENKAASAKPAKPVKTAPGKAAAEKKPAFKLVKVKIINGSSDFADLSLLLPFSAQIKGLNGGADGISSDQKATIKVDLKGSAYDLAPVDVNGEISPYQGKYNVNLNFDGLPMPLVTPYMVQFAGYKIEKGKLTLALQYQIENKKLNAGNQILIDQLELGEKVDNPDAVSLPLDLAITLLKDSEGKIKLDVPLTGSLEDPQFSVGGIIWDALLNVLTKIVTAPFSALASLAGSDEDLSSVAFKAGNDGLEAKEMEKLDGVAKALKAKTDLNIEIKGAAFEAEDWPALQDDALADQLKRRKAEELTKEEGKKIRAEYVELTEDDYNDLLADAFIEKFPGMAEKSIFGTPKLLNPDAGDFYKVAKQKMQESIKPEPERLKHLANDRAKAIAKYLVQKAGIPNSRVFILDSAIDPKRQGKDIVSALSLKTN